MTLPCIINENHTAHLMFAGINFKALKYHEVPADSFLIIISDTLSDSDKFSFSGITMAMDFRLAGYSQPLVFLSFLNKQQLTKFDAYGILHDQANYVWTLPVIKDEFTAFIDSLYGKVSNLQDNPDFDKIFLRRFQELFSFFLHGKSFDFINKITGPVRAACILAGYYPEKESLVWELFKKVNQRLSEDPSVLKLFFITPNYNMTKAYANTKTELSIHFVLLLKEFTGFKPGGKDIEKLIAHIDKLNHIFFQLTQNNG